jgi:2-polyprenyl-3-methyl-5-hydroxy-6-metoxy-1,4-benzoquinol methylase
MSYTTIDALRESLARPTPKAHSPEYVKKMLHAVPDAPVVDRTAFILERVKGKVVLDIGASGKLHEAIKQSAFIVKGIDKSRDDDECVAFDLDDVRYHVLPQWDNIECVVCGEVLEHLGNPGFFLARLRKLYRVPTIFSVPNAFTATGRKHLENGVENVNQDHVAWYSYKTLRTLLERYGYTIAEFAWYNGQPYTAEGLIVVAH